MKYTLDTSGLSARNRRILALGVRGAEGDDDLDLNVLIGQSEHTDDLAREDMDRIAEDLRAGINLLLEDPTDENIELAQRARDARNTVLTAATAFDTAEAERAERAAALLAEVNGDESGDGEDESGEEGADDAGDGEGEGESEGDDAGDEGDAENAGDADAGDGTEDAGEEQQQIAASRVTRVEPRGMQLVKPRKRKQAEKRLVLTASSNTRVAGQTFDMDDERGVNRLAGELLHVVRQGKGYRGPRDTVSLCSIGSEFAEEVYGEARYLNRDAQRNHEKLEAVQSQRAVRASGGICAAPPLQYDLPVLGTDMRPVRDGGMLARFGADRGGIRTLPPALLSDVTGAVGIWTEANDVSPSSPTTKPCITLDCPDETETLVDAITQCLTIGNYRSRYFPEQVREWVTKVAQRAAQVAEIKLLQAIGAGSKKVTAGLASGDLGTTRAVFAALDRDAAAMRNRHRLPPDFPLRVGFPAWLLDNMIVDLSREAPGASVERLATADSTLMSWFTARQLNPTFFIDGESGQMFGTQNDGALLAWPSHVIGYLYPEGTWTHLDGGSLDFGVTRDSTLNSTNNFQMSSEIFENVHFHGYESHRLDIDICPSGATSAPIAFNPCVTGS